MFPALYAAIALGQDPCPPRTGPPHTPVSSSPIQQAPSVQMASHHLSWLPGLLAVPLLGSKTVPGSAESPESEISSWRPDQDLTLTAQEM